MGFFGY